MSEVKGKKKYVDPLWSSQIASVFLVLVQTGLDSRPARDILKCKLFIRNCYKTSHSSEATYDGNVFLVIELSWAAPDLLAGVSSTL